MQRPGGRQEFGKIRKLKESQCAGNVVGKESRSAIITIMKIISSEFKVVWLEKDLTFNCQW